MHTLLRCFQSHPMFDAEGGGLGGGGTDQSNGAGSDGAAGGFADAGNATASFDGSISANAGDYTGGGAPAASDPNAGSTSGGFGLSSGGLDTSGSFGSPGGATVDLSQSGGVSSTTIEFSATDAAVQGAVGVTGFTEVANFDARVDERTGRFKLFECNPRFFLRLTAARLNGLDFVEAGTRGCARAALNSGYYFAWREVFTREGINALRTGLWPLRMFAQDLLEIMWDPLPILLRKILKEELTAVPDFGSSELNEVISRGNIGEEVGGPVSGLL